MNTIFAPKEIIREYSDMIYRIAIRYLENRDDADDLVQTVLEQYVNYVKMKGNFPDSNQEKYWLVRVTKNLCYNKIKYGKIRKQIPLDESLCIYEMREESYLLDESIKKLKDKYRVVMELFYIQDLKVSEISEILKISESAVKTRLKRAREKIKCNLMLEGEWDNEF